MQGARMVYTGVSKDRVKSEVIANKDWSCAFCRNSSKNCISCKQKEKEIKNLKSNIAEMEKAMQHLTYELKQNTERCVDLEDTLCREKKLRKRVEKDFDELKKEMEHNETSTCSSCDSQSSETDQRSPRKEDRRKKFTKKVKLQSSKSRKQSFSESQLVQNERKSNSDRQPKAKTIEEQPISENRSSARGNKTSASTKVNHSDNNIDRPTQNVNPNLVRAVDYLIKYTDLRMQSEQDQIDDGLLGDQEKECDERNDSQPIRINADQNRSYQHRPSFSANTRICDEFKRTGACLLSGCRFVHMDEDASYPNLTRSNAKKSIGSINQYKGRGKPVNNSRNFEHSRVNNKIYYNFKNNGYCKFGRDCKYQHVNNRPPFKSHPVRYSVRPASLSTSSDVKGNSSEFNSLLGSMKDIVGQLKA